MSKISSRLPLASEITCLSIEHALDVYLHAFLLSVGASCMARLLQEGDPVAFNCAQHPQVLSNNLPVRKCFSYIYSPR